MPLPLLILELAITYVDTPELINLCLVSKDFHKIAAPALYRDIVLTEGSGYEYAKSEIKHWNKATVLDTSEIEKFNDFLMSLFENKHLCAMIKSLTYTPTMEPEEDEWLYFILQLTNLQTFHYKNVTEFKPGVAQSLQKLSFFLPALAKSKPLTRLTELTLFYFGIESDKKLFIEVASHMHKYGTYRILKKLRFSQIHRQSAQILPWLAEENDMPEYPEWFFFFKVFAVKEAKLNLKWLGLDREFHGDCKKVANMIKRAVSLANLETFSLNLEEIEEPQEHENTLFECLTKHTPQLKTLIFRQINTDQSFVDSMERTLRDNIPNQLTNLWLDISDSPSFNPEPLRQVILNFQHNLVRLRLEDGDSLSNSDILSEIQESIGWYSLKEFHCEISLRNAILVDFGPEEPISYVSEQKIQMLRSYKKDILKLMKEHSIYYGAAENLPLLKKCYLQRFWINMKTRALICHDGDIPLE